MKPWDEERKAFSMSSSHRFIFSIPEEVETTDEQRQVSWLTLDLTLVLPVR